MSSPLDGSVALVTGASSGIGAAAALRLARDGATVALVARREDRLRELEEQVRAAGGTASVHVADVTDREAADAVVAHTVELHGSLDVLVNNAGVMLLGPAADAPLEEWERMIQVNVLGLLYCAHAALPHLTESAGKGRGVADLVNISSVAGRTTRAGSAVYNATKHAVGAFSDALRQEVTQKNVRVSLVEPGAVDTELAGHNRPEVLEGLQDRFKGMERLTAEDIADAISYIVTRPRRVAINEILVRPTDQAQ